MPISQDMLIEGEEVLVDTHPHFEFLARPVAASIVALALLAAAQAEWAAGDVVRDLLLALLGVMVAWLIVRSIKWLSISLTVTNRRLVYKHGVFRRDTLQLRYPRVSEVQCDQTLVGRLIGVGKLRFDVQGEGQPIVIPDVRHVRAMQGLINDQLDHLLRPEEGAESAPAGPLGHEFRPGTGPAAGSPGDRPGGWRSPSSPAFGGGSTSVHDRLIELDDLRQRGILSDEEFQTKKTDLLNRL